MTPEQIEDMTGATLNETVARVLGHQPHTEPICYGEGTETVWRDARGNKLYRDRLPGIPAYSTDARAAGLLINEIEKRHWVWIWRYASGLPSWACEIFPIKKDLVEGHSRTNRHEALCRAFLLAHYAEKEEPTK